MNYHIMPGGSTSETVLLEIRANNNNPATGLAFNTAGLVVRYTRPGAAPVSITLVSQTNTGAWVSGGFNEVDATNCPGLYRLDLPNAAIAVGVDQCMISFHGYSASSSSYFSFQLGNVSNETIYTAPFTLTSDQTNQDQKLDVYKGSALTVNLQMVDANNKAVSIGASVLSVKVYDLANTLIATYIPTVQFNANGEVSFVLDGTTTNTAGTYNIYITRTNGVSDVVSFGPLQLLVKSL
jgi:hypothetical protein